MSVSVDINIEGISSKITVRKLTGSEEMSRCYHYDVTIEMDLSDSADFNPIGKTTTLSLKGLEDDVLNIKAKAADSVLITDPSLPSSVARYRVHLVPDLWFMGLGEKTKIYTDKTLSDIISDQLDTYGIKYSLSGFEGAIFNTQPLVTQYKESSLNFVSRLLESRGLFYYFDHKNNDNLVVSNMLQDYSSTVSVDEHAEIEPGTWSRFMKSCPTKVKLTGYDFRKPSYQVFGEAEVASDINYEIHVDDEAVLDQDEASALAQVRLEQHRIYSDYVTFRGFNYLLSPGAKFTKNNNEYVVISINQSYVFEDTRKGGEENHYRNSVSAIKSDVLFRPKLITPIPVADGSETAHIYSETSSEIAMIDDEGLYTVKLNYITDKQSDPPLGKLRMQQPASGENDGIYFPLKNNTEVVLAFAKGNPDLPYIDGSMSCGRNNSHVQGGNQKNPHHSIIKARHNLVFKSLGGSHSNLVAGEYDHAKEVYDLEGKDDHKFLSLNTDGSSAGEMTELDELSGNFHVERRYGHRYRFINGNNYNWDNSSTYNFGNDYIENHEHSESAEMSFDLAQEMSKHQSNWKEKKNGLVKKTWGDVVEYHNGRNMMWLEKDGSPHEQYVYGSRYKENQVDIHGGKVSGGPGWQNQDGFVEKTEGDIYSYHKGNTENITEGDIKSDRKGNINETVNGDTVFKQTGTLKETHDGDVEVEFTKKVTTTTDGNIKETMKGDVETSVTGKLKVTLDGGRETKETQSAKHEFTAPLTMKIFSIDETTSGTKKETIKGPHTIEYSATVSEKGAQLKTQEAQVLQMKGSTASIKISLIMLG